MNPFRVLISFAGRVAAVACVGAAVSGCRGSAGPTGQELAFRLIADDTADVFDARKLGRTATVFEWTFRNRDDLAPWRSVNLDLRAALGREGLRVRFPGPDPTLRPNIVRALDADASAIDAIEIDAAGPRRDFRDRGLVQLFWAGPSQPFSAEASLYVGAVQDMGAYATTYTLPLAGHPLWKGRIALLRLDPTSAPDDTLNLLSIRGVKYEPSLELMAAALARSWKLALGSDLRAARLGPPGHSFAWPLQVPSRATLRFAYGVSEGTGVPIRFRVSLGEDGGPGRPLFEDVLHPRERGTPAWKDAVVDLAPVGGRRVSLVFETRAEGPFDRVRSLAAWAHPEVWRSASKPSPPNVVFVSLDTLRADRLSLYGNPRPTSPQIDRWARARGVVFENTVAPSPWTLPSHASMFTGLDALRHGVNHGYPVPRSFKVMADVFRGAGYSTAAVTGGAYVSAEYGFDRGFDSFYSHRGWDDDDEMQAGVDRCIAWLQRRAGQPFLLFLHTYAIHTPYHARQPYFTNLTGAAAPPALYVPAPVQPARDDGFQVRLRLFKAGGAVEPSDLAVLSGLYDSSIAYADAQLGRLLSALEALGLDRRTVVVVTSDHGEALGERGLASHAYLYDFNLLVPLVIALPDGRGAGRRIAAQVRSVDILPTLLELAGLPALPGIDGASLVPLIEGKAEARERDAWSYAASTNFGISLRVANRLKYIYNDTAWSPACGTEEVYGLDVDPREEHDLGARGQDPDRVRQRVLRNLASRASGLLVQLSNATRVTLQGSLEAPFLHQVRTKSPGIGCGVAAWNAARGGIDFAVAPGQSGGLVLQGVGAGELKVTVTAPGQRYQTILDPRQLTRPWRLSYTGSSWQPAPGLAGPIPAGVDIRWVGDVRVEDLEPSESNRALREQLKALGYVQ
jgi:arylsulfatase A-like enzyme